MKKYISIIFLFICSICKAQDAQKNCDLWYPTNISQLKDVHPKDAFYKSLDNLIANGFIEADAKTMKFKPKDIFTNAMWVHVLNATLDRTNEMMTEIFSKDKSGIKVSTVLSNLSCGLFLKFGSNENRKSGPTHHVTSVSEVYDLKTTDCYFKDAQALIERYGIDFTNPIGYMYPEKGALADGMALILKQAWHLKKFDPATYTNFNMNKAEFVIMYNAALTEYTALLNAYAKGEDASMEYVSKDNNIKKYNLLEKDNIWTSDYSISFDSKKDTSKKESFSIDDFIKKYTNEDNKNKPTKKEIKADTSNDAFFLELQAILDKEDKGGATKKTETPKILENKIKEPLFNSMQLEEIKSLQQAYILLIGQGAIGFSSLKKYEDSRLNGVIYYYVKPNDLLQASQYIIEKNGKFSYYIKYAYSREKELSLQAFLTLPSANKTTVPMRIEQENGNNTSISKIRYNLIVSGKTVASYYIDDNNSNIIEVYEFNK